MGKRGIATITQFDPSAFSCRIAGEVKGFDPANYIEKKEIKKMGRFIQFAVAAAEFALSGSGLKVTPEDAERVGVYIGSGIGGFEVIEREHKILLEHGPRRISPFFITATIINLASGYVSIRSGAKGPNSATATACTTSAHSIGDSFRLIQRGDRSEEHTSELQSHSDLVCRLLLEKKQEPPRSHQLKRTKKPKNNQNTRSIEK